MRKYFWLVLLVWIYLLFANNVNSLLNDVGENPMTFLLSIICAYILTRWYGRNSLDDKQLENLNDKKLHAVIEEHQGNLYLFEKDKNKFIMQARTFEECEKFLSEKYQNTLIVITSEDKKLIKKLKGNA